MLKNTVDIYEYVGYEEPKSLLARVCVCVRACVCVCVCVCVCILLGCIVRKLTGIWRAIQSLRK